jgi:hypothetical protein
MVEERPFRAVVRVALNQGAFSLVTRCLFLKHAASVQNQKFAADFGPGKLPIAIYELLFAISQLQSAARLFPVILFRSRRITFRTTQKLGITDWVL